MGCVVLVLAQVQVVCRRGGPLALLPVQAHVVCAVQRAACMSSAAAVGLMSLGTWQCGCMICGARHGRGQAGWLA